mgnify:CR=1 FL=1
MTNPFNRGQNAYDLPGGPAAQPAAPLSADAVTYDAERQTYSVAAHAFSQLMLSEVDRRIAASEKRQKSYIKKTLDVLMGGVAKFVGAELKPIEKALDIKRAKTAKALDAAIDKYESDDPPSMEELEQMAERHKEFKSGDAK